MSESIIIVSLLAGWAVYLGWYFRQRAQISLQDRELVDSFSHGLGTLGNARPVHYPVSNSASQAQLEQYRSSLVPRGARHAARRRRDVGVTLVLLCLTTLFAALIFGPVLWAVHASLDLSAAAFFYLAAQRRSAAVEHALKVQLLYHDQLAEPHSLVSASRVVNG